MRAVMVVFLVVGVLAVITGCGLCGDKGAGPSETAGDTIPVVRSETDKPGGVSINTIPPGVDVYIDGEHKGQTPMKVVLEEGKTYKLELKQEAHGYETQTMEITSDSGAINVNMRKQR